MDLVNAEAKNSPYWDKYYLQSSNAKISPLPSQFAAFAASEFPDSDVILDIGCGNGRDSLFFAGRGHRVVGIDASSIAIESCQNAAARMQLENAEFLCSAITDPALGGKLENRVAPGSRILAYARFFLHAIDEEGENALLGLARSILSNDGVLAVEFRTKRDAQQNKVTPDHYRRFIDPLDLIGRATRLGFETTYFVEGFGLAKYRSDDAHVARCVMKAARD